MKRLMLLGLLLATALLIQPAASFATWLASSSSAGSATATSVSQLGAPTVSRSGSNAVVSWSQGVLGNGVIARGYVVKRTVGSTTTTICTTSEPTRTCTDSAPNPTNASYVVQATYRNWVGPASDATSFTFDNVAPTTTLSTNPTPNSNGWVTSASTVTLTATDASSGVASITYKVGSAAAVTVNSASTTFSVANTGQTAVTYYATDRAGNVETTKSYTVRRDNLAPTTTASSNPAPNENGWVNSTPTLTLAATDSTSAVASITYKIGSAAPVTVNAATASFPVAATGTTAVTYYATDLAGNVESTKTYTVRRDSTAPTASVTFPVNNGSYTNKAFEDGCGTSAKDVCGNVSDNVGVDTVIVGIYSNDRAACLYRTGAWGDCFESNGDPDPLLPVATVTGTTWRYVTGNLPKGSYIAAVGAYDLAGNSVISATLAFTTQ